MHVDANVELLSILCRLAGHPEYRRATGGYVDAVDAHFAPSKDHAAVAAMADLRAKYGISYDAPMDLAVYLDASFRPIRALSPLPPGLDPRFEKAPVDAFVASLGPFASAARFDAFMQAQAAHHRAVEDAMRGPIAGKDVIGWFDRVLGPKPKARYRVAPGLLTGPMAYGAFAVHEDGTEDIVQIMYLEDPDASGLPRPTSRTLEYLVHELAHSYVNPVFDAARRTMDPVSTPLFRTAAKAMNDQHYTTPDVMVNESVVRAVTLLFLHEHSTEEHERASLAEQERLGFRWTRDLVTALGEVRAGHGGKLPEGDLVSAARAVFERAAKAPAGG
ncbi:MAG TPA: DUF4932 domain-containing protein [Polyangiaceae bacterium]|nr:DUF4932 domain-containing protein [Polyangiaceae bacterium]